MYNCWYKGGIIVGMIRYESRHNRRCTTTTTTTTSTTTTTYRLYNSIGITVCRIRMNTRCNSVGIIVITPG